MAVTFTWNGPRVFKFVRNIMAARARRGVNLVVGDTRRRLSTPYPPPSRIGEPPHRRTGQLRSSVSGDVKISRGAVVATIHARAPYARYLNPTRPFIGLPQDAAKLARVMKGG